MNSKQSLLENLRRNPNNWVELIIQAYLNQVITFEEKVKLIELKNKNNPVYPKAEAALNGEVFTPGYRDMSRDTETTLDDNKLALLSQAQEIIERQMESIPALLKQAQEIKE